MFGLSKIKLKRTPVRIESRDIILTVNISKTKIIVPFTSYERYLPNYENLRIDYKIIDLITSIKYLDIPIDSFLRWDIQIKSDAWFSNYLTECSGSDNFKGNRANENIIIRRSERRQDQHNKSIVGLE
ncbi:hypothetical protein NQ315_003911 [Exocentrus adspersus]|uniref:Uncharacterized protein n=1 Tax=Exocentrus adspersus TaxID=1586481 RepID=A0AAV8VZL0_9CUCU|nr:hypothetical protein NQ315_003911 [Exocentrus adspersus]